MLLNSAAINAALTGYIRIASEALEAGGTPDIDKRAMVLPLDGPVAEIYFTELFGDMREWTGSREELPYLVKPLTVTIADYERTISIPVNAIKDDQLGLYNGSAQMLGMTAADMPEKLRSDILNAGFTKVGYDGVAFYATTHPSADGGTQSNKGTAALAAASFQAGIKALREVTDFMGKPLNVTSLGELVLEVPPALESTAATIVDAMTGASGASNINYKKARLRVNPRLTSDTAWFLHIEGGPVKPFMVIEREKPNFVKQDEPQSDAVFNHKKVVCGVNARWAAAPAFWQLSYGSDGTT